MKYWIVELRNIVQGLEVSAIVCLQQSIIVCYVELFVSIYVCLMRKQINDNVIYAIHTCTHAQAYTGSYMR